MSYEEISKKDVKARKEYRCEWCGEMIQKGEVHATRAYRSEGDFQSDRMHKECAGAMRTLKGKDWDAMDNCFEPFEFVRGTTRSRQTDFENVTLGNVP